MITSGPIQSGLLALVAALPLTNALGCYSGGLAFEDLHGGVSSNDLDMNAEIEGNINVVCDSLDGAVFKAGDPPYTHCSNWTVTVPSPQNCCVPGILADCIQDCGGAALGSINRIDFQVKFNDDPDEKTMTKDICYQAFSTELGGCDTGSEQNHDGFWWKIDPNAGACAPSSTAEHEAPPATTAPASTMVTSVSSTTTDPTATGAAGASPYPAGPTTNEFSYSGYAENNPQHVSDREKIHRGFNKRWADVLQEAIMSLDDPNDMTFDRWFPSAAGNMNGRTYVSNVINKLLRPSSSQPRPRSIVADFVSYQDDFASVCNVVDAYFIRSVGAFHICASSLARLPVEASDRSCSSLGSRVSNQMTSITSYLVHEFFHSDLVGDAVPGSLGHIADLEYGAYDCAQLRRTDAQSTFINADNYAFFAINAYYNYRCNRSFGDPIATLEVKRSSRTLSWRRVREGGIKSMRSCTPAGRVRDASMYNHREPTFCPHFRG